MYARSVRQYYAADRSRFRSPSRGNADWGDRRGRAVLLTLAVASNYTAVRWSILAYSVGLMTMLGFSAAYHVQRSSERRDLLRRLDHAAIFVMIAGTYTPLYRLHLGWRLRDLAHQVDVACSSAGVAVKLAYRRRSEWASTVAYVAMGWAVVIFMQPLLRLLDRSTVILLVSGGALYSIGACIHRWHRLPFQMPSGTVWYWSPLAFYCRSDPLPETRSVAPTVDFHVSEVSLADDHRVTAAERYLRPRKFELIGRLITLTPYSFWRWQHSMHRSSWNNSTGARPVAWISTHRARDRRRPCRVGGGSG